MNADGNFDGAGKDAAERMADAAWARVAAADGDDKVARRLGFLFPKKKLGFPLLFLNEEDE